MTLDGAKGSLPMRLLTMTSERGKVLDTISSGGWGKTNSWPSKTIRVHSMNPVGRANMLSFIERYKPENLQMLR